MKTIKAAYLFSSAAILIATALAKFYSASTDIPLLQERDHLLHVEYSVLLPVVAAFELAVAAVLLGSRSDRLKFASLLWLSVNFMLYRFGFWLIGLPLKHCACLGNLTDALGLRPELVQAVMQGIVFYLFTGSVIGLLGSMWKHGGTDQPLQGRIGLRARVETNI